MTSQSQPYENLPRIDADFARIGEALGSGYLLHRELTEKVHRSSFAVHNELGPGFLEKVYETALMQEFSEQGISAIAQAEIPVFYKSRPVGLYFADILVDGKVICEIKAVRALTPEHQAQILHYLTATRTGVGLLLNFGASSLQFKRFAKTK